MDAENQPVHFKCSVHYPQFNDEGLETQTAIVGSGIELRSTSLCSSLAADILSDMFQKQEIDGKVIMKADNAKVSVQVREHWRSHPLADYVKEGDLEVTLHETFGDILFLTDNRVTIHVHLCHERDWSEDKVRNTIKKLLERYSQTHLERILCPFSQGMLSQISRDQYPCRLSTEKIKLFGAWYERSQVGEEDLDEHGSSNTLKTEYSPLQRGRKIVFSPVHEIPLLRSWYENDAKPSAQDLAKCADILNRSEFRKARESVTARHVNTWFKNERARLRREGLLEDLSRPSMAVCPSTSSSHGGIDSENCPTPLQ